MSFEDTAARMIAQLYDHVHYTNSDDQEKFSHDEVIQLRLSWNAWVSGDLAGKGFLMFAKMFEQRPETKEVFHFAKGQDARQMQNSNKILFHVSRVMKYIDQVVQHADSLDQVVALIRQAGGRHGQSGYDIPSSYFPHLGHAHRSLLSASYTGYNKSLDGIWARLWDFMIRELRCGQTMYGGGARS